MTAIDQTRLSIIEVVMAIDDMEQLVQLKHQAINIQQKRSVEDQEKELLLQLNHDCVLPEIDRKRFQTLSQQRVAATLAVDEQQELNQLIQSEEQLRLRRVQILGELARWRNVPLTELTKSIEMLDVRH
jgi:hypothetical protein